MAEEKQPPGVVEGATAGDVEDEVLDDKAKSAEDRKAAAALSKLDVRGDDDVGAGAGSAVDQEGLSKAMNKLGVSSKKKATGAQQQDSKDVKKVAVKVEKADVQLLVDELDLTSQKATDLLKQHDGDAVTAMKAFIAVK